MNIEHLIAQGRVTPTDFVTHALSTPQCKNNIVQGALSGTYLSFSGLGSNWVGVPSSIEGGTMNWYLCVALNPAHRDLLRVNLVAFNDSGTVMIPGKLMCGNLGIENVEYRDLPKGPFVTTDVSTFELLVDMVMTNEEMLASSLSNGLGGGRWRDNSIQ